MTTATQAPIAQPSVRTKKLNPLTELRRLRERVDRVNQQRSELYSRLHEMVLLADDEDLPIKDIAEAMGVQSTQAVRDILIRNGRTRRRRPGPRAQRNPA